MHEILFNVILYKKENNMPNKIIVEDVIDEMIDNINYIKLNTYIDLEKN